MSSIESDQNDATAGPAESAVSNAEIGNPPDPAEDEEVIDINLGCLREVEVEIPAEIVSKEWNSMVQRYTKVARVPGFRKGKVPANLVRTRFAEDIKTDVLEALVPEYFRQAVIKQGYSPITKPEIHSLETEEGKPIRFKAAFEIMPDIELGNYQDIKVDAPEVKVTDEDVDAELNQLQERQSSFDPVNEERPLQDGDFAQISFQAVARDEGAEKPAEEAAPESGDDKPRSTTTQPVQMDEVLVEIAGANTIPEFTQNLRGMKAGEERTFEVTYPAEHYEKRLAGKTFSYTAKVNAIKKKTTPELTDDFAKELSQDFQSLDDLKNRLREGIHSERQHKAMHEAREKLLTQLTDIHNFPVPETLVRRQIDFRLEQWLRGLAAQGMRTEDMKRMDFKRLRASQREAATREVKANLLLEKIAEAEHFEASDEEVQQEIHSLAQQTKQTPEAVQQKLAQEGALDRIRNRIRADKALHFLYTKSTANAQNGTVQE